jgi:predicted transcriptional regulator
VKTLKEEAKKLIEMVKKGIPDREIMKELGIQTGASLKRMYYDALVEAGKIKGILTERDVEKKKTVHITKKGTIFLGKTLLVEKFGYKEGDRFTVSKRKDSIILRKEKEEVLSKPPE